MRAIGLFVRTRAALQQFGEKEQRKSVPPPPRRIDTQNGAYIIGSSCIGNAIYPGGKNYAAEDYR